ncbi:MAG: TPM domain-containing protein [Verrucomicrobia bacterium]|nr:TPM domain-containing protein [Verrucomicrobiota bacterium]
MRARDFVKALDHEKVVAAIAEAEKKTSGEIRVFVTRLEVADALAAAREHFAELKMERTAERNAALILFAPRVRKFAVFGDRAIHEKCGDNFWHGVNATMRAKLQAGDFTGAVVEAVNEIGAVLAEHFPPRAGGEETPRDELPNDVVED